MFIGRRAPDDHLRRPVTACVDESIEVERVERLAELVEHEVGDIDHVVDRPQPDGAEPLAQPPRGRTHRDPFDHPSREARTAFGIHDLDLGAQLGRGRREQLLGNRRRRLVEPFAECRRELACDTDVAEAVRTVGGDLEVEDGVEGQDLAKRLPGRPLVKNEDAVSVLPHPELDRRAEHPWGLVAADGLHPQALVHGRGASPGRRVGNQVAGLDVGRPGHDPDRPGHGAERLQRRGYVPPEIEISELQMRRSGDRFEGRDPRDHEALAAEVDRAHLGPRVHECFDDGSHGRVEGRVIAQPPKGELHEAGPSGDVLIMLSGTRKRTSLS